MAQKVWIEAPEQNIPASVVDGRFIKMTLKNYLTPEEAAKIQYVAQGYVDSLKPFLAHNFTSLCSTSIRLLLSLAFNFSLRLFSHDLNQAYLQAQEDLRLQIFLRSKPEDRHLFGMNKGTLLKLIKPLHDLYDSGDY